MEVDDPRAYLLASLSLPPPRYVNCSAYKEFKCVRQTCYGAHDLNKYSIATIFDLVAELSSHKRFYYYVVHFVRSMLLWKGSHHVMTSSGEKISLPLNSLYAFIMAVTLIEKPYLLPSFSFLTFALVLFSSMRWRNDHPNPWWHCHSFFELARVLILGNNSSLSPETIAKEERAKEAEAFDFSWNELIEAAEKKAEARAKTRAEEEALNEGMEEEMEQELEDAANGAVNMSSELLGSKIDNLRVTKKFLYPIQKVLLEMCRWVRFGKNVFLWEEPLSFWLALGSLSLSVVFIKLQVVRRAMWILGWVVRIVTWTVFGPWMKLLGEHILDPDFSSDESKAAEEEAVRLEKVKEHEETLLEMRVKNEYAYKLRDFRQYFFGKFLTKVHILKFDRYIDTPLSTSSAKPWVGGSHLRMDEDHAENQNRLLSGLMISLPDIEETKVNISGEVVPSKHILLMILPLLVVPLLTVANIYLVQNGQSVTLFDLMKILIVFYTVVLLSSAKSPIAVCATDALPSKNSKYQSTGNGQELVGSMIPYLHEVVPNIKLRQAMPFN